MYRITGYIQSRNFRRISNKLNFEGCIFVFTHTHNNLCSRPSGFSNSYIFIEVMLFKKFKNKTPSNKPVIQ